MTSPVRMTARPGRSGDRATTSLPGMRAGIDPAHHHGVVAAAGRRYARARSGSCDALRRVADGVPGDSTTLRLDVVCLRCRTRPVYRHLETARAVSGRQATSGGCGAPGLRVVDAGHRAGQRAGRGNEPGRPTAGRAAAPLLTTRTEGPGVTGVAVDKSSLRPERRACGTRARTRYTQRGSGTTPRPTLPPLDSRAPVVARADTAPVRPAPCRPTTASHQPRTAERLLDRTGRLADGTGGVLLGIAPVTAAIAPENSAKTNTG
jgi:hypothetical protein